MIAQLIAPHAQITFPDPTQCQNIGTCSSKVPYRIDRGMMNIIKLNLHLEGQPRNGSLICHIQKTTLKSTVRHWIHVIHVRSGTLRERMHALVPSPVFSFELETVLKNENSTNHFKIYPHVILRCHMDKGRETTLFGVSLCY